MARVYLDHLASAPLAPEAREAILATLPTPGHPSSPHAEGRQIRDRLEEARSQVAVAWGCRPREVLFTASGTVASQLALLGAARARRDASQRVVLSGIEHPAIDEAADALGREGFDCIRVPPLSSGRVDAERFLAATEGGAAVAAMLLANHETGVCQPVATTAASLRARGVPFVVDACLGPGRVPCNRSHLEADFVALSAHKFGGPRGVGLLILRRGTQIEPLWRGGRQEEGMHAGTPPVALAAGAAVALDSAIRLQVERASRYSRRLAAFLAALSDLEGWRQIGDVDQTLPGVATLELAGVEGEAAMINLDLEGVAVSTGSACALGATQTAPTLLAMGMSPAHASRTLRVSFGEGVTTSQATQAGHVLTRVVERLRRLARR